MDVNQRAEQALKQIGATLLRRYSHPDSWTTETSSDLDHVRRHIHIYVLTMPELSTRSDDKQLARAQTFVRAIKIWAKSVGLHDEIQIVWPHRGPSYRPRLVVDENVWPLVLSKLQTLTVVHGERR